MWRFQEGGCADTHSHQNPACGYWESTKKSLGILLYLIGVPVRKEATQVGWPGAGQWLFQEGMWRVRAGEVLCKTPSFKTALRGHAHHTFGSYISAALAI